MSDLTGNHARLLKINTEHYLSLYSSYRRFLLEGNERMVEAKKQEMKNFEEWIVYHLTKLNFIERELGGMKITWPTKMENDRYNDLLG